MKPDDLLKLIKNRRTIRKYQNKPIPIKIINKIIEAGRWGPSLMAPGFQPWKFIIINDKDKIKNISDILLVKSYTRGVGRNTILRMAAQTISNAQTVIVVYNTLEVSEFIKRINKSYHKFSQITEVSAIAASIQNMILVAYSLGVETCWLEAPMFCKKEINKLLGIRDEELVAILTLGYPAEKGKRSKRKPIRETVKWFK